jgi:hypothetical protein
LAVGPELATGKFASQFGLWTLKFEAVSVLYSTSTTSGTLTTVQSYSSYQYQYQYWYQYSTSTVLLLARFFCEPYFIPSCRLRTCRSTSPALQRSLRAPPLQRSLRAPPLQRSLRAPPLQRSLRAPPHISRSLHHLHHLAPDRIDTLSCRGPAAHAERINSRFYQVS